MDQKTKELVGIAAAVAGHCQKCFDYHFGEAGKLGVTKEDIAEAVELAKAIRQAGANGMDEFVTRKQGRAADKE